MYAASKSEEETQKALKALPQNLLREYEAQQKLLRASQRLGYGLHQQGRLPASRAIMAPTGRVTLVDPAVPDQFTDLLRRTYLESEYGRGRDKQVEQTAAAILPQHYAVVRTFEFYRNDSDSFAFIPRIELQPYLAKQSTANPETGEEYALMAPTLRTEGTGAGVYLPNRYPHSPALRDAFGQPRSGVDVLFRGVQAVVDEDHDLSSRNVTLQGLGEAAVAWLESERAKTRACLEKDAIGLEKADKAAKVPLPRRSTLPGEVAPPDEVPRPGLSDLPGGFDSLSQVVKAWCDRHNAEVVLELDPAAERLSLVRPIDPENGDAVPAPAPPAPVSDLGRQLAPYRGMDVWSLEVSSGVLVVKNRFAFLDRVQLYPMAALLHLLRAQQAAQAAQAQQARSQPPITMSSSSSSIDLLFSYPALRAYWQEAEPLAPSGAATWNRNEDTYWTRYLGVPVRELDAVLPIISLWEQVLVRQREALLAPFGTGPKNTDVVDATVDNGAGYRYSYRTDRSTGIRIISGNGRDESRSLKIPLAQFSPRSRERFLQLARNGEARLLLWSPQFPDLLASTTLHVGVSPQKAAPGKTEANLSLFIDNAHVIWDALRSHRVRFTFD